MTILDHNIKIDQCVTQRHRELDSIGNYDKWWQHVPDEIVEWHESITGYAAELGIAKDAAIDLARYGAILVLDIVKADLHQAYVHEADDDPVADR